MNRSALNVTFFAASVIGLLLLAYAAAMVANGVEPPPVTTQVEGTKLALGVKAIITEHRCADCHSPRATKIRRFDYIEDLSKLRNGKLVNLKDPELSELYLKVKDDDMPNTDDGVNRKPLSDEEKSNLLAWIKAGAPNGEPLHTVRPTVSLSQLDDAALQYLNTLPLPKQGRTRFFSLASLSNDNAGVTSEELMLARVALAKMLNSISWEPEIAVLHSVPGSDDALVAVDLTDAGIAPKRWEEQVLGHYPYGVDTGSTTEQRLRSVAGSQMPVIRADWFVFVASHPPLYHTLLGLATGANALSALESVLKVDRLEDIRQGKAIRAGFATSGVSANNRMIERHRAQFGAYWLSYDFFSSHDKEDVLAHPLGPVGAFEGTDLAFVHAGGEAIFSLPNGLQGYLLAKSNGQSLNEAPANLVRDNQNGDVIVNGISCIGCHANGMRKDHSDQVLARARSQQVPKQDLDRITMLYPEQNEFTRVITKDEERFLGAMRAVSDAAGGKVSCKYDLSNLTEHRCPKCGRVFDPIDSRTVQSESPRSVRTRCIFWTALYCVPIAWIVGIGVATMTKDDLRVMLLLCGGIGLCLLLAALVGGWIRARA